MAKQKIKEFQIDRVDINTGAVIINGNRILFDYSMNVDQIVSILSQTYEFTRGDIKFLKDCF